MTAIRFLTACLIALLVVGCSDAGKPALSGVTAGAEVSTASPARPAVTKVAVILKSLTNPFFVEMARGARVDRSNFVTAFGPALPR